MESENREQEQSITLLSELKRVNNQSLLIEIGLTFDVANSVAKAETKLDLEDCFS